MARYHFFLLRQTDLILNISCYRCFLGQNVGPAQHPNANRYMEAGVSQMREIHPSTVAQHGKMVLRWTLTHRGYQHIKDLVVKNPKVTGETAIHQSTLDSVVNVILPSHYLHKTTLSGK